MGEVWCCEGWGREKCGVVSKGWGWEECSVVSVDELPSVCGGGNVDVFECMDVG